MKDTLQPGITHTMAYRVPPNRTVPNLYPESADFRPMPEVFATGYLVGLLEWACMETLHGHLDAGEDTLGVAVDISHDAPTLPGMTVTVDTEVVAVDGRVVTFRVTARDEAAQISSGTHRRAVILRERFEQRLAKLADVVGPQEP